MTTTVTIPSTVANNVRNRWPDVGERWCSQVLGEFDEFCTRYQATPVQVLPARYALVISAETGVGRVVARSTPDPDGPAQAAVAQALAEHEIGPQLLEVYMTDVGTWTIAVEVIPGTSLADLDPSTVKPDSVTELFRRLAGQPAPPTKMGRIDEWLRYRLTDSNVVDLPVGQVIAPEQERHEATSTLDGLVATGNMGQLCHGDSYPGNVLMGNAGRLLWIDPRGMTGEASYDVAVFSLKASRHVVPHAVHMATYLAEQAGIDPDRARSWVGVANAARV